MSIFDIDKVLDKNGVDQNVDNHLLNEQFHVFSKSPASVATALGDASNRSGHTVTASDVWGQEIPAFFYAKTQAVADTYKSLAKTNDLCRIGNSVAIFENDNWVVKYNSYTDIPDGHKFKNANGDEVIRFHKNRLAYNLNLDNNAADDGLNTTAKIQGWDDVNGKVYDYVATAPKFVTQFVTSTDKIVDGIPSKGFGPFVMAGTTTGDITKVLPEGTSDSNHYIANSFAGIIQFNKARTDAIYVHAFEYCGKTLKSAYGDIEDIKSKLGISGGDDDDATVTERVGSLESAIKTLTGKTSVTEVTESIATTANTAATAAVESVNVTSTGEHGIVASQTKSVVSLEITPATVAADGTITNGDNVVTANDAKTIADIAATAAITNALKDTDDSAITKKIESEIAEATLEGKISDDTDSTQLVTAEQVVTYVSENAKVTLTADTAEGKTGITINPNASESTSFTIGIDQSVIATTDYVDDAIDALSATDGVITTLTKTVNTAQQNAAASQEAAEASETAAKAAQAAAEAAKGEATTAKAAAEAAQAAAQAAQGEAEQATANAEASASAAAASKEAAESSASAAATSAEAASASQTAAAASQTAAEKAAADAASAKTTVEGFEATLNAASLNATDTLDGMFTITTEGTVKGGFTKFEIADSGLGNAINTAKSSAVSEVLGTNITAVTGKDNETSPKVTVQLSGTVQKPSLAVTTSDIASAASLKTLTETVNTHIENAAGLYLSVEKVEALPETDMKTNKIYLVPVDTEEGREKNIHTEYIWTGTTWEIIGTTAIDINSLEEAISGVSQVVADTQSQLTEFVGTTYANDKKTLEDSIKAISDKVGETDVDAQIAAKIDAIGTGATQGTAGVTLTQSKGVVTLSVAPGKVESGNTSVVTGGAVFTAVEAATTAANNAQTSANKKLASIGNDGDTRVIIGTPTADGDNKSVTIKLASTVATTTDGTAYSKTETDNAVKVAKDAADSKIAAVEVTTDAATHLGAHHISATTDTDKKVTVAVSCSDEWSYTGAALTAVTSVINGKMSDGKTIDDANLTSAEGMFQDNTTLTTYVGSLGKLTNGKNMFKGCTGLTTFVADLASLTDGTDMFAGCALTEESLMYIVDSLPVASEKTITVGVAASVKNKADYAAEALKKGWTLA